MRTSGFDPALAEIIGRRLKIVTVVVVVMVSILLLRLWFLQIIKGPMYRAQSENNRIHLQSIPPFRGLIMDKNGELLVDNRPSYDLYVIPEDIQDPESLFANIKRLIPIDAKQLKHKLKRLYHGKPFNPVLIKKNISREELAVVEVNLFNLPGVYIEVRPRRNYIYDTFASHIIGYLGEISEKQLRSGKYIHNSGGDLIGQYGIEGIWQNDMNGTTGGMQVEVDATGRKLRTISKKMPVPGYNVYLTIDKNLQLIAEDSLKGKTGAIVALDPNNGEVLALASSPDIDPNKFIDGINTKEWNRLVNSKNYPLQNRAIRGQYAPGSVFKIIVALAGLQEGVIDPDEELYCSGSYKLGNRVSRCWKKGGHGKVNLHKALRESCDIYFFKVGKKLGIDTIARYARMFGLGRKTGIDLDYEADGLIPDSEWKLKKYGVPWQQGETISSAIGQSFVLVTPIQAACMISAVFNGGVLYQPRVVKKVGNKDGDIFEVSPVVHGKVNISPKNMELVKQALVAVVNEPHGTATMAKIKGITVAGKTGTAQVINMEAFKNLDSGGEVPEKYRDHAWFVAVAPAEHPKIAISVLIEHGGHGGSASAPVAVRLIKEYLKQKPEQVNKK